MALAPGDKCITLQTKAGPITIPYTAPAVGDVALFIPDKNGNRIAVKYNAPAVGDPFIMIPDKNGKMIAFKPGVTQIPISLLVIGGHNGTTYYNDIWNSTDWGVTWTKIADGGFSARYGHRCTLMHDGSIVLTGGMSSTGLQQDTWRSTDHGLNWTRVSAGAGWGQRRSHAQCVLSDDTLVLMGGYCPGFGGVTHDVWKSTNYGANWTRTNAAAPWHTRDGHDCVVLSDDTIVVFGGGYGTPLYLSDVWISTDIGVNWTQVKLDDYLQWYKKTWLAGAVLSDDAIVITGGAAAYTENGIWRSTDGGANWSNLDASADYGYRESHTLVVGKDGNLYLIAGIQTTYMNDVWKSDDGGSTWAEVTASAAFSARSGHQCVDVG